VILKTLGETKIFSLFVALGTLLGGVGAIVGSGISALIIFLQNKIGFIKVGVDSVLVDTYPMEIHFYEYLCVILLLTFMSGLLSIYPARKACKFNL
jgi:lipoprotein-releasing system permease protein